jgi:Cupin superfamily protein
VSTDSREVDPDPLEILFGRPSDDFVPYYAGRAAAVSHASVVRLEPVLKNALVEDFAALARLAERYSQPIRAAVVGADGVLGYRALKGDRAVELTGAAGDWFIFDRLESHFNAARRALLELCYLFSYPRLGATCTGFFHTRGASVPRHCDEMDVVVVQLFGSRSWCFEPNSNPPTGVWDPVRVSVSEPQRWDAAFGEARQLVELTPGSALYLPGAWWHQTRSSSPSFSLTFALPGAAADPVKRSEIFAQ